MFFFPNRRRLGRVGGFQATGFHLPMNLNGTKVRVHRNLHRGDWSVTIKGKVVANVEEITLQDCTFYVCESTRVRVHRKAQARGACVGARHCH
jgi:hypothetical protein